MPFLNSGTTANQVLSANYFGINGPSGVFDPNAPFLQPISSQIGGPPSPTGALAPPNPSDPTLAAKFQQSPGYQYALSQTSDAIQNSAAGRTGAISGNMLRALQGNAQGLASQDYGNFYNNLVNSWSNLYPATVQNYQQQYSDASNNRNQIIGALSNMASAGQGAGVQQGNFGQQAVTGIGNNIIGGANAQAAGTIGSANALTGGINGVLNSLNAGGSGNNPLNFLFGNSGGGGYYGNPASTGGF